MTDQSSGRETTIVDNEVFNVLSSLVNKLQALAAYDKYEQDGSSSDQIWQEMRQQDQQAARRLLEQLNQFAQNGRLQAK